MSPLYAAISYPPIPIFEVGPFNLSLHGFMAAIGFLVGAWYTGRLIRSAGYDINDFYSVVTWALIGALIGTRYGTTPAALLDGGGWQALHPFEGNFSIMGGLIGGISAGGYRVRRLSQPLLPWLDLASFGLAIGTVIGRLGDIFIVEHLGKETTVAWGYGIKPGYDVAPQHNSLECSVTEAGADGLCGIYHHAAAYDLLGAALLFGFLTLFSARFSLRTGQLFSVWVIWYGLQRFLIDFYRFGSGDATVGSLTWNQVIGLCGAIAGVALFWWWGKRPVPEPVTSPPAAEEATAMVGDSNTDDALEWDELPPPVDATEAEWSEPASPDQPAN